MSRNIRTPLVVVLIAAVVTLAAIAIMPRPAKLSDDTTGDAELAQAVRDLAGNGHRGLSVALVEDGAVRFTGIGTTGGPDDRAVDETTGYELGSITKGMTGMLLADSGLDPDTPVADLLPQVEFGDDAIAAATLAELASH
jgi:CubicO group peptidase (beta-lactamase class C family)